MFPACTDWDRLPQTHTHYEKQICGFNRIKTLLAEGIWQAICTSLTSDIDGIHDLQNRIVRVHIPQVFCHGACRSPLTVSLIRKTEPASKPVKLADGGGMYLLLQPEGSRYWRLDYRFEGKRKTLALGVYPDVSLKEARKRRQSAKALLAEGRDPAAVRKASKSSNKPIINQDQQAFALSSGRLGHNAQWARLMGLDALQPEHTWQEALACVHEQEREEVMAAIRNCLAGHAAFEYECRIGARMAV